MSAVVLVSVLVRAAALAWSIPFVRRLRDWRGAVVVLMLAAMFLLELAALLEQLGAPLDLSASGGELGRLVVSVLVLAAIVVIGRMVRDAERAQRSLRIERTYLEHLFHSAPEGVALLDVEDRVQRVNEEFTRIFGYRADEVVGRRINDLIVPDNLKDEGLGLTTTVTRGHTVNVETVRRRADGTLVPVSILGAPIKLDGGRVGVFGIYRDLTQRRQAEVALRQSEERYRTILNDIEDGYYEVDVAGNLVAFNDALCELLGRDAWELLGMNNREYMDAANASMIYMVFNTVYCTGRPARLIDFEVTHPDGSRRHVEGSVSPVTDAEGAVVGCRGIVRDTTERKEAEVVVHRQLTAIESAMDGMAIFDANGRFVYVNEAHVRIYGYQSPAELLGKRWKVLYQGSELARFQREIMPAFVRTGVWRGEAVGTRRDGSTFPQEVTLSRVQGGGLTCVVRDITARRQAEAAIRESEERYALAARGANDGLWDWNVRTGAIYFSPRWKAQLGYEDHEIRGLPDEWFRRVHPDDLDQLRADLDAHIGGTSPQFENEHRMRHRGGQYRWMLSRGLAVRDESGIAYRIAGSQTDVTDRKTVEERLQFDAFHDTLTGLPNRSLFMDRLDHALRRAKRRGDYRFAVLFLDLDRFKIINDSLGHALGDRLLQVMAQRLETCVRPGDTVARLGGDEFVLLVEEVAQQADAIRVAERIHLELARPLNLQGHDVYNTASIGIALCTRAHEQPEDLLRDADLAMFRAKTKGKSRHEVFDSSMHERALDRLELESDLRRAMEREELFLEYQPIVSLETGALTGFEALLRWEHPTRGRVMPEDFIHIAEETGLILPIGLWVLEAACRQMQHWHDTVPPAASLTIHVNLSGRQFIQRDLVKQVDEIVRRTGLDPEFLSLEITESVVMDDAEAAAAMLGELRALNVRLQIDDFGTGYSSLSYLHRFPIDTLKIDRSFVTKIGVGGDNSEIVRSIITLARDLKMDVIAEGVETVEQIVLLRELGCFQGQGNYLSAAVGAAQAAPLLTQGWRAPVPA